MTNVTTQLAVAATNDIRGIKPPVAVPDELAWLWWTLGVVGAAIAATVLWRLLRKRLAPKPAVIVSPHVRAKEKLAEALRLIGDPKAFCTAVSDTIRGYLEERFSLRAPERTTEEFLVELRSSPHLTRDQKQSLGAFLESCDLVKFARFEPTEQALRELHDSALRLIDETQYETLPPTISSGAPPPFPPPSATDRGPGSPPPPPPHSPHLQEAKRLLSPALSSTRSGGEGARRAGEEAYGFIAVSRSVWNRQLIMPPAAS